jgi:predicted alpha/beta superfamily hydrolase
MPDRTRPHTLTGDIRVHESFPSVNGTGARDRTVLVYLPPGYDGGEQRYPVLYLNDGQNVFDQATAFSDEWRVDETAQQLIKSCRIEPLIIVGIYNAGDRRVDEYTPTVDPAKGGGGADIYGRMLVDDLKPFIDATYRTLPDPENTALGGSSLGGLLTLYLGLRHPTTFGKLAVLSPSVWWGDGVIVREVEALPRKTPQRMWVDAGRREGDDVIPDVRRLRDALVDKGWSIGEDLMYFEARGGEHNERSWAKRVRPFLKFLFPPRDSGTR